MHSTPADPENLNDLPVLPTRNKISLVLVLGATALNAFNDNILKMMLVGLAPKVAAGALGSEIGAWLGAMILLPFVMFAPVAGWLSDRFAKRSVLISMLVAQAVILLLTGACFEAAWGETSVLLALGTFFLLAVQSTIFSPSKMGILKELAGSRRLGMVSGWLQMVTMVGILAGLGVGGAWFDAIYTSTGDPWVAAARPIWILFTIAVVALLAGLAIQRTPSHPELRFHQALWWEHFKNLRECLTDLPMRRAFLGNSTYWFVASMLAAMFVDIGLTLHPDPTSSGAASASSQMTLMVGVGTVVGSLIVAWVNRRGLQLGIIPLGAVGLALTLIWSGAMPVQAAGFDHALLAVGLLGGCYMVPIQTFIQDRAEAEKRGRVLSSMNLSDSIAGVLAVLMLVGLKALGLGFAGQFWTLGVIMIIAAIYTVKLMPHHLLRFIVMLVVRSVYKVRAVNHSHVPARGGVLLLANHVSYVDALILGAACERQVRFVMWDVLYNVWWMRWFLRIVGTVPISATRAKDAIRSVAAALKEGQIVCLFPEGQITRHGNFNELRKGFELMARQGEATVVPVLLDGLYGSIFSHEGGRCFAKWPKKLRYPVTVHFGTALTAREASTDTVFNQWLDLCVQARQQQVAMTPAAPPESETPLINALSLLDMEWARASDTVLCLDPIHSPTQQTLSHYVRLKPSVRLCSDPSEISHCAGESVIVVGSARAVLDGVKDPSTQRWIMVWDEAGVMMPESPLHYRGVLDAEGRLISFSQPDPPMPKGEEGNQRGQRPGSLGRVLPGVLSGTALKALLANQSLTMSEDGFLFPAEDAKKTAPDAKV